MNKLKNITISLLFLRNSSEESYKLYFKYVLNIVVGYLLLKGCNILVSKDYEEDAILCLDRVWISLRYCFYTSNHNVAELDYYLQVFLNQNVLPNETLDLKMMKRLGELYPRQVKNPLLYMRSYYLPEKTFFAFAKGIDPFNKVYISNLNQRILFFDAWLQTQTLKFSKKVAKKLYILAVLNLEKQPLAPYYLCFYHSLILKLTKQQYLRFLRFCISLNFFQKYGHVYADILNLDVMGERFLGKLQHMTFHLVFPQVFVEFDINSWNFAENYISAGYKLLISIFRSYVVKLIFKYYAYLRVNSLFLISKNFWDVSCDYNQISNVVNTLSEEEFLKISHHLLTVLVILHVNRSTRIMIRK